MYVYPKEWESTLRLINDTFLYGLTGNVFACNRDVVRKSMDILRHAAVTFYINGKSTGSVLWMRLQVGGAPLDKLSVVVPFSSEGPHCWCLALLSSAVTAAVGSGVHLDGSTPALRAIGQVVAESVVTKLDRHGNQLKLEIGTVSIHASVQTIAGVTVCVCVCVRVCVVCVAVSHIGVPFI